MNIQRTKHFGMILGTVMLSQSLIACVQTSDAPPPAATAVADVESVATARPVATYVVQHGDRMVDIAADHGISLSNLLALNDIPNPDMIEVGDVIFLEEQPSAQVAVASESGSAGDVGVAAGAPVATGTPLPRIVQVEAVDESFQERFSAWWADAPKPSISGDAAQQGIFAAIVLPAAVVGFVLLLIAGRLAVRLTRVAIRFGLNVGSASAADGETQRSEHGESAALPKSARRRPSFAFVGRGARGTAGAMGALGTRMRAKGFGWLIQPLSALMRATVRAAAWTGTMTLGGTRWAGAVTVAGARWAGAMTAAGARSIGRLLHLNAQKAVDARTARRERVRDEEIQRDSRVWWSQGRERLRIGLLDEAEECFETGLRLAVEGGWQDEIALYRNELHLLLERRNMERSLVPSGHEA
jgi:LysM domain-containing protein